MRTILIEATPWNPTTGANVPVAMAGGGVRPYQHRNRNDWLAGVISEPKFSAQLGFDENGFSGGARPEFGVVEFRHGTPAKVAELSQLNWAGCPITVLIGDDELSPPVWVNRIVGQVETLTVREGALQLKIRDSSADLDKPVASDTFAGTGGVEGDTDIAGRVKRRTFGRASNVEALLLKKSTLIWEVGDPSKRLNAIPNVFDMGRGATSLVVVNWAGSIAATLAALEGTSCPQGGGAVAPSIACIKWWTQPVGPLTANIEGEIGTGYVDKAASIAERLIGTRSALTISNTAAMNVVRPAICGIHIDSNNETIAQALDRLLRGTSLAWAANADGTITINEIKLTGPVETVKAIQIDRTKTFKPMKGRKLGYFRNHRIHSDGELSAALLDASGALLTAGANWSTNLTNRPGELTDGRVPGGLDGGGNVQPGKANTNSLASNAVTAPALATTSSVFNLAAATKTLILSVPLVKALASSLVEVSAQAPMYGADSVDIAIFLEAWQGGSAVAGRQFLLNMDANGYTELPFQYEEFFESLGAGSYDFNLYLQRTTGNPCRTSGKIHIRAREYKR